RSRSRQRPRPQRLLPPLLSSASSRRARNSCSHGRAVTTFVLIALAWIWAPAAPLPASARTSVSSRRSAAIPSLSSLADRSSRELITRYAKIVMSLVLAAFCPLVTFDNITDYGTNYLFVQHVMSMDTTFPGNALMYRSITNPVVWRAAYA